MKTTPLNSMSPTVRLLFIACCAIAVVTATMLVLSRPRRTNSESASETATVAPVEAPRYDAVRDVERVAIGSRPKHFIQPTHEERIAAAGDLTLLPAEWRPLFDPRGFNPLLEPMPGEWLAQHPERHQSYEAYLHMKPNRPTSERQTIYLLPLDQFTDPFVPKLEVLREMTEAYFGLPTQILPVKPAPVGSITSRVNDSTGKTQWLTRDVLQWLQRELPEDAYCLLAVTLTDLYPDPKWNYVFGQATLTRRVGVYSFSRFDPEFFGKTRTSDSQQRMLWRSCRLLTHEAGHMFGMLHCVYYSCGMNGTNSQFEADSQPLALCPVCLRKLQACVGFNPLERDRALRDLSTRLGFTGTEHLGRNRNARENYQATGADE